MTIERPRNGDGVERQCEQLARHAKATGHGINDVVAELAWQWFKASQTTADDT